MHKAVLSFAALALLVVAPLSAQENRPAAFIYEAYYSVDMADTEEWNRQYREYSVPVLRQLVDEGVIEGFTQMQHQTGGIRFLIAADDHHFFAGFCQSCHQVLSGGRLADTAFTVNRTLT